MKTAPVTEAKKPGYGALRLSISLLVAGLCLWIAAWDVDLRRLGQVIASSNVGLVLLAGLLSLAMNAVKCTKLKVLLARSQRIRYSTLFSAEMISVLVDVAFPFRLQELVKAYVVGRREGIRPAFVLGVEVVEKLVEVLFLVVVICALWLTRPIPDWVAGVLWVGVALVLVAAATLGLSLRKPAVLRDLAGRLGRLSVPGASRAADVLLRMIEGMRQADTRPSALLAVVGITAVEWVFLAAVFWTTAAAVDIHIPVSGILGVLVATFLAFAAPTSSAGSVGIFELMGKTTLVLLLQMEPERALGLVILYHAVMVGFGVLGGVLGLMLAGLSLGAIKQGVQQKDKEQDTSEL